MKTRKCYCQYCGKESISKGKMAHLILKMINYPKEKYIKSDGNFTSKELSAIYIWIKEKVGG